ncbi:MAG: DUF4342 domain-containing protein [Ardenticatenaceae bacterium]
MSTQTQTTVNTPNEVIEVQGNRLIGTVKSILAAGKVNRLVIYRANGDQLLDIPYAGGLTVTALATLFIPPLAVLTPLALLLGRFKIEIVRPESEEAPTSEVEVEVEIEPATPAEEPEADQLEHIRGIGKVFAGRLRDAGIQTFAELAELTPERISEIVSEEKSVPISETQEWIDEARELSKVAF